MGWVGVELEYQIRKAHDRVWKGNNMIKYVGTHITKDNVELEKLLREGYSYITEQGYALSDDEDISTDDIIIEDTLATLYDRMEG